MPGRVGPALRRAHGRTGAKSRTPDRNQDLCEIEVQRLHSNNGRTRRINASTNRVSIVAARSIRSHRETSATAGCWCPLCCGGVKERSTVAVALILIDLIAVNRALRHLAFFYL